MPSPSNSDTVTRPDGRRVAYAVHGDPTRPAVVSMHGTPGSLAASHPSAPALKRVGACVIAFDRPGYGGSDPLRGRSVGDVAADVVAITEALGIETFAVYGISGGGPHALACAALLPDRVTRVASLVGIAPYAELGATWTDGMTPSNVTEFDAALAGWDAMTEMVGPLSELVRDQPDALAEMLERDLPEPDKAYLRDPGNRARLVATTSTGLRAGVHGWVDDDLAFVAPWGFEVAGIGVPTLLWHGDQDALAPIQHTEWLHRAIPGSTFIRATGAGHLAAFAAQDDVLAWLVHGTPLP